MKDPKDMTDEERKEHNKEAIRQLIKATELVACEMIDKDKILPDPLSHISTALGIVAKETGLLQNAMKTMMSEIVELMSGGENEEDEKYNGTYH